MKYNRENSHLLIADIYEVLQTGSWTELLKKITISTGSKSAALVAGDQNSQRSEALYADYNIDPWWFNHYNNYFVHLDPTFAIVSASPGIAIGDHVTGENRKQLVGSRREFYHDMMLPQEYFHTAACGMVADTGVFDTVILQRTRQQGAYQKDQLDFLSLLSVHIRNALTLKRRLNLAEDRHNSFEFILNQLSLGVILVNQQGRPIFTNQRAENLIQEFPDLSLSSQRLTASDIRTNHQIQSLLAECIRTSMRIGTSPGAGLRLQSSDQSRSLELVISPISNHLLNMSNPSQQSSAVIFLSNPTESREYRLDFLCHLYQLTNLEARFCNAVCEHFSPEEFAMQHELSEAQTDTLLANCRRKLGVSSLSSLISVIKSGPLAYLYYPENEK